VSITFRVHIMLRQQCNQCTDCYLSAPRPLSPYLLSCISLICPCRCTTSCHRCV